MRFYDYYTFGEVDEYGQDILSTDPQGQIKIAIYVTNQTIQDNVNYKNCSYIGITKAPVEDKCVIQYGDKKLKVLYVTPSRGYKQVFMSEI